MPQDDVMNPVGKGIALIGFALVASAVLVLFYIGQTVNHILNDPTQVPVVKFLVDKIGSSDQGISGTLDGKAFDVHLGEPIRYMMYVIMGGMALGIMTRVFSGLMLAGTGMIKAGSAFIQGSSGGAATGAGDGSKPPGF